MTKTIREQIEERESRELSSFAAHAAQSRGRIRPEKPCRLRTCFQRDRDRVVHCKAFRRLTYKTQVFIAPEHDHYRTRLTHTLEVAQIARTIARALRLNEDLTEAIALAHDLGHTPFGHAGEWALDEAYRQYDPHARFRHYEQSLRVVELLEKNGQGLNLTWEVRDGIGHHSKGRDDLPLVVEHGATTLEGRVVMVADRIAYVNHDVDDALRGQVISGADLPARCVAVLGSTHAERINRMVVDLVEHSLDQPILHMSPEILQATDELKDFLFARVYSVGSSSKAEVYKVGEVLGNLFRFYMNSPQELGALPAGQSLDDPKVRARAVCDHIAGMTDRFAQEQFITHFLPQGWGR